MPHNWFDSIWFSSVWVCVSGSVCLSIQSFGIVNISRTYFMRVVDEIVKPISICGYQRRNWVPPLNVWPIKSVTAQLQMGRWKLDICVFCTLGMRSNYEDIQNSIQFSKKHEWNCVNVRLNWINSKKSLLHITYESVYKLVIMIGYIFYKLNFFHLIIVHTHFVYYY